MTMEVNKFNIVQTRAISDDRGENETKKKRKAISYLDSSSDKKPSGVLFLRVREVGSM